MSTPRPRPPHRPTPVPGQLRAIPPRPRTNASAPSVIEARPRPAGRRKLRTDRLRLIFVWPVVAVLAWGLMFNPLMKVQQMVALGSDFSEEELNSHFNWDAWKDQYIWAMWFERGTMLRILRDHPEVQDVSVRFVLPSQVQVTFTPKKRYAAFVNGDTAIWVAEDFSYFSTEPASKVAATRIITGLSPNFLFGPDGKPLKDPFPEWPPQPSTGDQTRYYYSKILQLWRWIDAEQNPPVSQVASLEVDPERGMILHYKTRGGQQHPPILIGYGPELEHKYGQALTIYRSHRWWDAGNVEIDLRFDRNVVRTLPATLPATLTATDATPSREP
ncbi:MAG: hypothetical protein ABI743_00165 [bacterium]